MKLTVGAIHDLYVGLKHLERDDETMKFAGDTWIKIAVNVRALEPIAVGYERARMRALGDLQKANRLLPKGERREDAEIQADFSEEDRKLRDDEHEVDLKTLLKNDLRLDDNPKLGGRLARFLPMVDGIEGKPA